MNFKSQFSHIEYTYHRQKQPICNIYKDCEEITYFVYNSIHSTLIRKDKKEIFQWSILLIYAIYFREEINFKTDTPQIWNEQIFEIFPLKCTCGSNTFSTPV